MIYCNFISHTKSSTHWVPMNSITDKKLLNSTFCRISTVAQCDHDHEHLGTYGMLLEHIGYLSYIVSTLWNKRELVYFGSLWIFAGYCIYIYAYT